MKRNLIYIFILFFLLCSPYLENICSGYLNFVKLDAQEFLLWHYGAFHNLLPYKDYFYPYGIFTYFRNYNVLSSVVFYIVAPLLFAGLYFIFSQVFKLKYFIFFSLFIFYVFIITLTGIDIFARYGVFVVGTLLLSYLLYSRRKIGKRSLFVLGIVLGSIFLLIPDQGGYLLYFFALTFLCTKLFFYKKNLLKIFNLQLFQEVAFLFFGFFVSFILLMRIFLPGVGLAAFFNYMTDVSEIAIVAKTPFFTYLTSPANIFTFSILFAVIVYQLIRHFIYKQKISLISLLQLTLIFDIILLEQKSIFRSIDRQITFVAFLLLLLFIYELIQKFRYKMIHIQLIYSILILLFATTYSLASEKKQINIPNILFSTNLLLSNKCYTYNRDSFFLKNPSYSKIVELLKAQNDFNGKVFSFTTEDTAFYVLLNQKPPYYNSIFEGSTKKKQERTIQYIKDNQITYITLNTNLMNVQDSVPDYIRQPYLFNFIINNYYPFARVGEHTVLKKSSNGDFFTSEIINDQKEYLSHLLSVPLYKIPYSEGMYKYNVLHNKGKLLFESSETKNLNEFLNNFNLSSNNKFLVMIPSEKRDSDEIQKLTFALNDGRQTKVSYSTCRESSPCVINLSHIPLFYKTRQIRNIEINSKFHGEIQLYELQDKGILW